MEKKEAKHNSLKTLQRAMNDWLKQKEAYNLMSDNSPKYTFDPELANSDVSKKAQRFTDFKTKSDWKPSDRGNEPVFGHPTKKKNNSYWPYQISSPRSFQNSDYREFFNKEFSDTTAREDINHAIATNKLLSKVGSPDGRTYAITEGEQPGYSSYVMPLNIPTPNEELPKDVRRKIIEIIQSKKLELDPKPSSWNSSTTEVWIKIVPDTYKQEIAAVLDEGRKEAKKTRPPEDDAAIEKLYDTWQKINNQADWHHVWPQWLGGAEIQTPTLYMPRWIHDFAGDDKLGAVAFHQHLRAVWEKSEFYRTYSKKGYKLSYEKGTQFQEAFNKESQESLEAREKFIRLVKEALLQAYKNAFEEKAGQSAMVNQISQILDREMQALLNSTPQNTTGRN